MSTGALWRSLVNRLILVSRKPHGARSNKPRMPERMSVSLHASGNLDLVSVDHLFRYMYH